MIIYRCSVCGHVDYSVVDNYFVKGIKCNVCGYEHFYRNDLDKREDGETTIRWEKVEIDNICLF